MHSRTYTNNASLTWNLTQNFCIRFACCAINNWQQQQTPIQTVFDFHFIRRGRLWVDYYTKHQYTRKKNGGICACVTFMSNILDPFSSSYRVYCHNNERHDTYTHFHLIALEKFSLWKWLSKKKYKVELCCPKSFLEFFL